MRHLMVIVNRKIVSFIHLQKKVCMSGRTEGKDKGIVFKLDLEKSDNITDWPFLHAIRPNKDFSR